MSGAAMGMLAGATVGAMGMYLNARHPRQVKKALKRAGKEAEKAILENRFYEWVKKYKENRE